MSDDIEEDEAVFQEKFRLLQASDSPWFILDCRDGKVRWICDRRVRVSVLNND